MQIHRLTEIVFALLKNERITAKELASRFEVSQRTVYRDIEVLSAAGIPIYTNKGNGGGIIVDEDYRLNNAMLSQAEKQDVITVLTAYNASVNSNKATLLLEKLSGLFKTSNNFIEVDFSDWRNDDNVQKMFDSLQCCIVEKCVATVDYCNASGEVQNRKLEPLKLIFKHRNWYLYAFCQLREENRLFKLSRLRRLTLTDEKFTRVCTETNIARKLEWKGDTVEVTLKISKEFRGRMVEEWEANKVETDENGDFILTNKLPMDDWMIGFLLSFGDRAQVLQPQWLNEKIKTIHKLASEL